MYWNKVCMTEGTNKVNICVFRSSIQGINLFNYLLSNYVVRIENSKWLTSTTTKQCNTLDR